jgi:hypothetical protein
MAGYIGSRASVVSSGAERKKTFDITTTTTVLTGLSYTPTFVHLFHNGVRLVDGTDYTATNGTSITLTAAAQSGDQIVVVSYAAFQVADAYTKAEADDRYVNVAGDNMTGSLTVGDAGPLNAKVAVKTNGVEDALVLYSPSVTIGAKLVLADNLYQAAIRSTPDGVGKTGLAFDVHQSQKMHIDSSGRVTMPYQPAFVAYNTTAGSYSDSQMVVWSSFSLNRESAYNTNNGRFTAPTAGLYQFSASVRIETGSPNASYQRLGFRVNDTTIIWTQGRLRGRVSGEYSHAGNDHVIGLSAGDYVTVQFQSSVGTFAASAPTENYFSGYLIG